ncbi:DIS3-like exonuclease 2 [Clytia hemisphaerica]|uniref:DIS3-like exonuclease 2 n=1 Tax=Clytia hemisphaerica TaxID=252671 RepID=UPI0034D6CDA5
MNAKGEQSTRKKNNKKSNDENTNAQSKAKKHHPQKKDQQKDRSKPKQNNEERDTTKNESTSPKKKHHSNKKLPEMNFAPYLSKEECSQKLKRGELIKGTLRINPRNFVDAFISSIDSSERDIYIEGVAARNRSLPGDIVAVQLNPKEEWKTNRPGEPDEKSDKDVVTKTGKVVYILEEKHPRVACGFLKPFCHNQFGFALLSPNDNRLPRLMIPLTECPDDFKNQFSNYAKTLFIAKIVKWEKNKAFAGGKIMRSLGEAGHIEPETESILLCNDIDSSPFSEKVLRCLPDGKTWKVTSAELSKRRDMRKECVFTIDPATARDLDDALSCKKIADGLYEVGVHIADVSYFIEQNTALDDVASQRATSVYLAQKVIPMLPNILCEQLCSLNPGVERLAYSVFWNMKSDGTIMSESFGRTVISSCVKLSYDHAQRMIETDDVNDLVIDEFPPITGDFSMLTILNTVKNLFGMSKHLRQKRFDSGALRLDQPKLSFTLDSQSGMPNGCAVYQYKDSNRMIEEFMLLANMAVGRKIYKHHPNRAVLRNHAPPQEVMMEEVAETCKRFGIPFDISNSSTISASLKSILAREDSGFNKETLFTALTMLCTKPFQNAKYFCTGTIENESAYRHYALNVPIYTHFTSPIRRYPDVMVHRLLTASLDKSFVVEADVDQLQTQSDHCNDKKWAAKKASEQSSLLFFAVYLLECGPLMEKGVVVGVLDKAVDVLCTRVGNVVRAYMDKLPLIKYQFTTSDGKPKLALYWFPEDLDSSEKPKNINEEIAKLTERFEKKWEAQKEQSDAIPEDALKQELCLFSEVNILLKVERDLPTKILGILAHPKNENTPLLEF